MKTPACELSIVVSALNEERNVRQLFRRLTGALNRHKISGEIIFLDNHSTDRTGELASRLARKDRRITVIRRRGRPSRDLGSSLREGFTHCRGQYVLIMDADLSHDPDEIPLLFRHRKEADIIIGSRYVPGGSGDMPLSRSLISRTYNTLARILTGAPAHDITTGFKLYRRTVLDSLHLTNTGFGLHVEILLKALRAGATVREVPIHYSARTGGRSKLSYRRQFRRYAEPLLEGVRMRLFG
ncbi:MAG: glycosyltransferase [Candidatus Aenigmarchaeota archaeon]|nr:glycosyltransferase [Candidatus Aenigmarchaeota archaeon]